MLHPPKLGAVSEKDEWRAEDAAGRPARPQQPAEGDEGSAGPAAMLGRVSGGPGPATGAADSLPLHMRLMRRGEQATTLFSLLLQLALYSRSAFTLTAQQHLHQFALLLLRGVCLAAATLLPTKVWLRWRVPLIAALRLSIALVPSQRSAQVRLDRWLGGAGPVSDEACHWLGLGTSAPRRVPPTLPTRPWPNPSQPSAGGRCCAARAACFARSGGRAEGLSSPADGWVPLLMGGAFCRVWAFNAACAWRAMLCHAVLCGAHCLVDETH